MADSLGRFSCILSALMMACSAAHAGSHPHGDYGPVAFSISRYPCLLERKSDAHLRDCLPEVHGDLPTDKAAAIRRQRALLLYLGRDGDGAIAEATHLIKENPNSVEDLHWLARFNMSHGPIPQNLEIARSYLDRALAIEPGNKFVKASLAYWLSEHRRTDEARTILTELLEADPGNTSLLWDLSQIEISTGQRELAIETMDRLVRLEPNNTKWRQGRGNTFYSMGLYSKATDDFSIAAKAGALESYEHYLLSIAARKAGRFDIALTSLDFLIEHSNDFTRFDSGDFTRSGLLVTRGLIKFGAGKLEESAADILNAIEASETNTLLRAQVLFANMGFEVAIDGKHSPKLANAIHKCLIDKVCLGKLSGLMVAAQSGCKHEPDVPDPSSPLLHWPDDNLRQC